MKIRRWLLCATVMAALPGCHGHAVNTGAGPVRKAPAAFSMESESANAALSGAWYESFQDDKLSALMDGALRDNLDIAQALARLRQAEALARQAAALRGPAVNATADSRKTWEDGDPQQGVSSIGADLAWEIDIFNRLGAAAESGRYETLAAAEAVDAVRLGLTAAVAEAYYNAVAQRRQIGLLRQQADMDGKLLELMRLRLREGLGTRVDVLQQEAQLADTESLIPAAQAELRVHENRLDVLLGLAPDAADRIADGDDFAKIGDLPPLGVPSDLLLNRPDLRRMKNELLAADADIGAAMADRLPRVTLTGSYALVDGPVFAGPAAALLGGLVQPLLDWGRRRAEVARNRALYEERLAAFTQAYLVAIEDVENALYRENRQREFLARLEQRRRILDETVSSAQEVFRQGLSDYLPVLDALKDLRVVERMLVLEQRNFVLHRIALFRAIGAPLSSDPGSEDES